MDGGRIAIATLATLASGIALGLAANPTMRTFPEPDWRARYRAASPAPQAAPQPAPQPGVSYFGDGSTAWLYGGAPERLAYDAPSPPGVRYEPERWVPSPPPDLQPADLPPDDFDAQASTAERAAAQAAVRAALVRSDPRPDPPAGFDQAGGDAGQTLDGAPGG